MNYSAFLNTTLKPRITEKEVVLDLFAGCGGLSLGFEAAGYKTVGFEMDKNAADTYNQNLSGTCVTAKLTRHYDYPEAQIIIGGPPCQPFSVGGNQKGADDSRNGFPMFIDAVKQLNPKVFLFENVRGLLYTNKWYFEQIVRELQALDYLINFEVINAVNYGVPQNRERLVLVGHKSVFSFPQKHLRKIIVSEAINDLIDEVPENSKFLTTAQDEYIARYERASFCINPRDLHPNKPSRTLTCRNLAGATGDMHRIKLQDGRRRRLSIKEAARLQSFPDWFVFLGGETNQFNQIGNAVPPFLAYQLAKSIKTTYNMKELTSEEIKIKNFEAIQTVFM